MWFLWHNDSPVYDKIASNYDVMTKNINAAIKDGFLDGLNLMMVNGNVAHYYKIEPQQSFKVTEVVKF